LAAVVAHLHNNPEFMKDLALAKSELENLKVKEQSPVRDCAVEAEALSLN